MCSSRHAWPLALLAGIALGCGPSVVTEGQDGDGSGGTNPSSGTDGLDAGEQVDSSGGAPTPIPVDCDLAPLEIFDIEALVGEETVLQDLEVLDSGEVVVAGYFGLARGNSQSGEFERVDAPEVVTSSFVRLVRGPDRELWASAFDQIAHSTDAGDTWQTWTLSRDALVHRIDDGGDERIVLGGDAIVSPFENGETSWITIPALDGDRGTSSENNAILSLVRRGGRRLAVERFGRMAGSDDGEVWTAIDGPRLADPELLDLGDLGLLLLSSSGEVHHSDDGDTWAERGRAGRWPQVASQSTQLAYRRSDGVLFAAGSDGLQVSCDVGATWATVSLGTESDVIYDVSVGADGSMWAAGFNEVFRIGS